MKTAPANVYSDRVYNTGKVCIGLRAARKVDGGEFPTSSPSADSIRLQSSLTGKGEKFSTGMDWDGVYIILGVLLAVAAALLWFWSRGQS